MLGASLDNFKRNVGGWRGGLLSAGDALGVMAQTLGSARPGESSGRAWGRALGAGSRQLGARFEQERVGAEDREFRADAKRRAEDLPEGSRERQYLDTIASGNKSALRLLPSLWSAQSYDARSARAGQPTAAQAAKNRKIRAARETLARIQANPDQAQQIMMRMGVENLSGIINDARTPFTNEPDPDYESTAQSAIRSPLAGLLGFDEETPSDSATGSSRSADEASETEDSPWIPNFIESPLKSFFSSDAGSDPGEASSATGDLAAELEAALSATTAPSSETPPLSRAPQIAPPQGMRDRTRHNAERARQRGLVGNRRDSFPGGVQGRGNRRRDASKRARELELEAREQQDELVGGLMSTEPGPGTASLIEQTRGLMGY